MSETEAFLSTFDPMAEEARFPAAILADYAPDSCLAEKGDRFVWRMRRRSDGALFVLKAAPLADKDLVEEFCILARLSPLLPGQIPAPVSYFQDSETEYLIRSYLPGMTLTQYREQEDGCSPEWCVQLGQKLCAVLETIHSQQPPVIHRDIKPENILLLPSGEVALIDFSIARQYKAGQDTDTRHMGTRATAAPEQYGYAQTDCRTDLYALGMTLIWLLTGSYRAEALPEAMEAMRGPKYLREVLEIAVSFAPDSRYQDAASFSSALAGHPPRRQTSVPRRKPRLVLLLLVLLAGLTVGAGFLWRESRTVSFSSLNLEDAVRLELDRPEGPIASLTGLETLYLAGNPATDYGPLAGLENLRQLRLGSGGKQAGEADSLAFLESLDLRKLVLDRLRVLDGSWQPLTSQKNLDRLELFDPPAGAIEAVGTLSGLRELHLYGYGLRDLTPLAGLSGLNSLVVRNLESLEGVQALSGLRELRVTDSGLSDLSPLGGLSRLRSLQTANIPNADFTTLPKDTLLNEIRVDEARMAEVEAACPGHSFHILPP